MMGSACPNGPTPDKGSPGRSRRDAVRLPDSSLLLGPREKLASIPTEHREGGMRGEPKACGAAVAGAWMGSQDPGTSHCPRLTWSKECLILDALSPGYSASIPLLLVL